VLDRERGIFHEKLKSLDVSAKPFRPTMPPVVHATHSRNRSLQEMWKMKVSAAMFSESVKHEESAWTRPWLLMMKN
jgi:hypothetical protein